MDSGKEQSNDARIEKYSVGLTAGRHTMFLYCDLVDNEILGDTRSALLRANLFQLQPQAIISEYPPSFNGDASSIVPFNQPP